MATWTLTSFRLYLPPYRQFYQATKLGTVLHDELLGLPGGDGINVVSDASWPLVCYGRGVPRRQLGRGSAALPRDELPRGAVVLGDDQTVSPWAGELVVVDV